MSFGNMLYVNISDSKLVLKVLKENFDNLNISETITFFSNDFSFEIHHFFTNWITIISPFGLLLQNDLFHLKNIAKQLDCRIIFYSAVTSSDDYYWVLFENGRLLRSISSDQHNITEFVGEKLSFESDILKNEESFGINEIHDLNNYFFKNEDSLTNEECIIFTPVIHKKDNKWWKIW